MSPVQQRFIFVENGLGSALFNLALNGVIAWGLFRGLERVPLWGQQSIAGDTIATCFFLPFFTALIVTALARRRMRSGEVPALDAAWLDPRLRARVPSGPLGQGSVLGTLCMLTVAPATIWLIGRSAGSELALWPFITFKALFAAGLAALVTPLIAALAITSRP